MARTVSQLNSSFVGFSCCFSSPFFTERDALSPHVYTCLDGWGKDKYKEKKSVKQCYIYGICTNEYIMLLKKMIEGHLAIT